jgi:hypothetical protein
MTVRVRDQDILCRLVDSATPEGVDESTYFSLEKDTALPSRHVLSLLSSDRLANGLDDIHDRGRAKTSHHNAEAGISVKVYKGYYSLPAGLARSIDCPPAVVDALFEPEFAGYLDRVDDAHVTVEVRELVGIHGAKQIRRAIREQLFQLATWVPLAA